ncbi:hypothetical protein S245_013399, partial [Arachis hypogaea]
TRTEEAVVDPSGGRSYGGRETSSDRITKRHRLGRRFPPPTAAARSSGNATAAQAGRRRAQQRDGDSSSVTVSLARSLFTLPVAVARTGSAAETRQSWRRR